MSGYCLAGRTVLITGAARGIGAQAARQLHRAGANVALVGLEPACLKALATELGDRVICCEADVACKTDLERAVADTLAHFGGIDVLIANAGIYRVGSLVDAPAEDFERTIQVNLFGVWHSLRAAMPSILKRQGYVLIVSSVAGLVHGPLLGAYAASKAAVDALANSLRIELAPRGVAVGCAYFGAIDTDLVRESIRHPAMSAFSKIAPRFISRALPVSAAAALIESGIRQRAARLWAPAWVGLFLCFRGLIQPLMERRAMRDPKLASTLELARQAPPSSDLQRHPR